ncbi:MAG: hypothetical protein L6R38_008903 [Xanthoria sp. 2 TBL-2021]|nr:MAG: hypothetical protein L6R38_008903 [Xanthoria sp. 2 TBL-2021]
MEHVSIKRQRVSADLSQEDHESDCEIIEVSTASKPSKKQRPASTTSVYSSLRTSISPPPIRQTLPEPHEGHTDKGKRKAASRSPTLPQLPISSTSRLIPSPMQLSTVNGLADSTNVDTVSLRDILGDPLIKECWLFNYLIDVDFIMSQLDEDTRDLVQVKIVHGSWKEEDVNRINIARPLDLIRIQEAAKRYDNVQVITAYMAEMYWTHHSKMIILFRHDDTAQINIVTGNFIVRDWSMCQAVWRSPLLPLQTFPSTLQDIVGLFPMGGGYRFKRDILQYLNSYGQRRTGPLTAELKKYEFFSIRAALVASVPGKQNLSDTDPDQETLWGWPGLKHVFRSFNPQIPKLKPHIVTQCSSVASISKKWMEHFQNMLRYHKSFQSSPSPMPRFSLIFPTADEIRRSVDGYGSGGSIHMKTQTSAQRKQLEFLKPMLCHWAGDERANAAIAKRSEKVQVRQAQRRRAAPHIKTYIRFSDENMTTVDWALMTSANLSKQAWGEEVNGKGEVRICSYEIGVVVWPALWDDGGEAEMVPVFGKDTPDDDYDGVEEKEESGMDEDVETTDDEGGEGVFANRKEQNRQYRTRVGLRMPYDLPLVPYADDEMPWCAAAPCSEPDWMGRTWPGFGNS